MNWTTIKPLKEGPALTLVKKYFENACLKCEKIDERKNDNGKKSPDFKVIGQNRTVAYCEVKTPENVLNSETSMYHWDTTFYKLRKFIHKAVKQFKDYDSAYELPRIIAFTSNHPQLNWTSFQHNILGAVAFNGEILRDFNQKSFIADSNKDFLSIDLVMWLQVSHHTDNPEIYQVKYFLNPKSKFYTEVLKICKEIEDAKNKRGKLT